MVKESAAFIVSHTVSCLGQLVLRKPKLPDGIQESIFKGKVREGSRKVCDQLVHNSLIGWWLGNRAMPEGLTSLILRFQ